ncbi:MAG: peptidylprolyl isomerase [Rickettsiales bacterium]|nr:peptidylprolyl isomerase [Rickettsiales bacterium]
MKLNLNFGLKNIVIAVLALATIGQGAVILLNQDAILGSSENSANTNDCRVIKRNFSGELIALADGKEIYEQEVRERLNFITGGRGSQINLGQMDAQGLEAVAREAAVQKKVLEEAYLNNIQNDPELQNRVDDLVENIYKEKYLETIAKAAVTEEKLKSLYDELVSKAKTSKQYKVKHILLRSDAEARQAIEKIKSQRFEDVAKSMSVDKQSAVRGGDLGYIFPEEFVLEFSQAVKKLGKGQTSGVVKTEFGYHIIRVEDIKDAEILPYEKSKPRIEKQLGAEAVKTYIEELSKKINVNVVKQPAPANANPAEGQAPVNPESPATTAPSEPSLNPDEVKN